MSGITEASDAFQKISEFFADKATELQTNGVGPDPDLLYPELVFDELLTFCYEEVETSASFIVGAAQEAVSTMVAVKRELDMGDFRKSSLYSSIQSDDTNEEAFYSQSKDFFSGILKGGPTNGSQC